MTGDDEQAGGPDGRDSYESLVLGVLDREMAKIRPKKEVTEKPDELDALVSDLLKQVMTVSDQDQTGTESGAEERGSPLLENAASEQNNISSNTKDVLTELESEPNRFESRDAMLAEYVAILEKSPSSENSVASTSSEPEFSHFEDSDELLAEFMPPKETVLSEQYQDAPSGSGPDASQFEALDTMLAEFMSPQEDAPPAETVIAPPVLSPAPLKPEKLSVRPAVPVSPPTVISPPENKLTQLEPIPIARPGKAKEVPFNIRKPETKSSVILKYPAESAAISGSPVKKADAKPPQPASASGTINGKALLLAAACICLLAVLAVPGSYFANTSKNVWKPAGQQPAPAAALPNHAAPPLLISQVSPKYPVLAAKRLAADSVVLDLSIDKNGNVVKADPVSGSALFHAEAVRAAMKWRYKPASLAGSNVPANVRVTFNFSLKN